MRPFFVLIVSCALATVATAAGQRRAEDSGRLVTVSVAVQRADGAPVAGLSADDFEVVSDGKRRAVELDSAGEVPLTIVLLFDLSASTRLDSGAVNKAIDAFIAALKPGDRARLGVIAGRVALGPRFSGDARELREAGRALRVPRGEMFGPSPVWDAIDAAAAALQAEPARRLVVAVSDGRATGNARSLTEVSVHALMSGVSINIVGLASGLVIRQTEKTAARVRPGILLQQMADDTGGVCLFDNPAPFSKPGPLIARIVRAWRQAYTLRFAADVPDGRLHALQIRVGRSDLSVRAPKAYLARF